MNKTITLLIIGVIFLALLLMLLNASRMEERHGGSALLTEKARSQENPSPVRTPEERSSSAPAALAPLAPEASGSAVLAPAPLKNTPPQAESASRERSASAEGIVVKTVPAQIDAGQTHNVGPLPQAAAPARQILAMPEPGAKQTSGGSMNITNIVVFATQEGATLRLGGDKPLVYTSMLLRDPDRLVLDLAGQWNVSIPGIPQNRLIKAIRVGRQADSTRMVVDLHGAPASYRLVKTSPQGLDVRLR
jgi:hypothetical protein